MRESLQELGKAYKTSRICYPAMNTTALSAIPGAALAYVLTGAIARPKSLRELAIASRAWIDGSDLRLDQAYQAALKQVRTADVTLERVREAARLLSE